MFNILTVRGLPLYKLAKSDFCPSISILAHSWCNRYRFNPITVDKSLRRLRKMCLVTLVAFLTVFPFYLAFDTVEKIIQTSLVGIGLFLLYLLLSVMHYSFVRQFVRALNQLDEVLTKKDEVGLAGLPHNWSGINEYLGKACYRNIVSIRSTEITFSSMDPKAVELRKLLEVFKDAVEALGFPVEPYGPQFARANAELADRENRRGTTVEM